MAEETTTEKPEADEAKQEGDGRTMRRMRRKKRCRFDSPSDVDYKDIATLQKLITAQGKIMSRKRSGNDAPCQRATKQAIKRARFLGLLPYIG